MRFFYSVLLFSSFVFSATIDTKLYENTDQTLYYDQIKKQIENSEYKKSKDNNLIQEELSQLTRVKEASKQEIQIDAVDVSVLKEKSINVNAYYNVLKDVSLLKQKVDSNTKIGSEMQSKIFLLKKTIENITESDKDKLLLLQLQFAYYKLQQKNIEIKKSLLEKEISRIKDLLLNSIDILNCGDITKNEKIISIYEQHLSNKKQEILSGEIQKEKALIEENNRIENISNKIDMMNLEYQDLLSRKVTLHIINAICSLKNENNTAFYKANSDTQSILKDITDETQKELFMLELTILKEMFKVKQGHSKLLFGATIEETKAVFENLKEFLTSTLFVFNEQPISLFSLFKSLMFIIFGFLIGMLYKKWILKVLGKWEHISMMSIRLISNIGYYLIVLIFIIISISSLGIDMTSLSLIAGALSIGIGFGLQTVVSNLFAGIILMFERTIRVGDIIEINDSFIGTVTDMRIRSTTIKTFDNIDIVVPNSSFIQNNVINMTFEDRIRRLHVPFSVAYGTEIEDVKKAVLGALEDSSLYYIKYDEEKKPDIWMTLMNSSSVDLELIVWVYRDIKLKKISVNSDFLILIYNALRANNISIPFPQLDVYMKNIPKQESSL